MDNKNKDEIKSLLEQQLSYQRRIAKDLHSLYLLVIASIILGIIAIIFL